MKSENSGCYFLHITDYIIYIMRYIAYILSVTCFPEIIIDLSFPLTIEIVSYTTLLIKDKSVVSIPLLHKKNVVNVQIGSQRFCISNFLFIFFIKFDGATTFTPGPKDNTLIKISDSSSASYSKRTLYV